MISKTLALLAALCLIVAACGSDDDSDRSPPPDDTEEVSSGEDDASDDDSDDASDDQAEAEAEPEPVNLVLWTFAENHAKFYEAQAEKYREEVNPGFELEVSLVAYADMHDRLLVSLQSGGTGAPDIADIEQGRMGSFLRAGDPGLVDLTSRLDESGKLEDIVKERLALYAFEGENYGIEHALTPVVMYYRQDLWEQAGIDPTTLETWDDFIAGAIEVEATTGAKAIPVTNNLHQLLLRQRGSDLFNADGEVLIDSDLSIETWEWILDQVDAGIAAELLGGEEAWTQFNSDEFGSVISADWYSGLLEANAPDLSGLWRAMPLPVWESGGLKTSVFGGTGATIVKTSDNVEPAWDFLNYAMLSVEGNVNKFELTGLWPAYIPAMSEPSLLNPREYFGDQVIGEVFAEAAEAVPAQFQSPFRSFLQDAHTAAFQDLLLGNVDPAEALTKIAEDTRAEMEFG